MTIMYRATGADGTIYTITREVAGGAFTPRADGVVIRPDGKLRDSKAQCRRHNGSALEWVNMSQMRALGLEV